MQNAKRISLFLIDIIGRLSLATGFLILLPQPLGAYSCLSAAPAILLSQSFLSRKAAKPAEKNIVRYLLKNLGVFAPLRERPFEEKRLYDISDHRPLPPALRKSYNFRRRCLLMENLRYHFVDEGNPKNPVILMLHGNPTWSFFFRRLVDALKGEYRIIAPDHMGCGLSDKPQRYSYTLRNHMGNVEKLMDHLGLKRITLICHDWGGAIGMGVATRRPDLFSRFVVFNTAAWRSTRMSKRIRVCRIPFFGTLAVRGLNGFALAATRMAVARRLEKGARAGLLWPYDSWQNRIALLRFVQDIPMNPSHPSYDCLKETEGLLYRLRYKPMKICWGMKDWCFDGAFLKQWQQRFPDASVTEYPNAGHYILEDAHEMVIPHVNTFLAATRA